MRSQALDVRKSLRQLVSANINSIYLNDNSGILIPEFFMPYIFTFTRFYGNILGFTEEKYGNYY